MTDRLCKALLLDLDGTLAQSLPVMHQAYLDFLAAFGKQGTPEEFDRLNGPSLMEVVRILQETHDLPGTPDKLFIDYLRIVTDRYARFSVPKEGARELLSLAKSKGLRVALVTSSDRKTSEDFLALHGLSEFFDAVVTGEDVTRSKPDPTIYRLALARLGVRAEEALAVEDSLHGLRAATGAGIRTLAMDPENRYRDIAFENVPARVASLADVLAFLREDIDASGQ